MKSLKQMNSKSIDDDVQKFSSFCSQADFSEDDLDKVFKQINKVLWINKLKSTLNFCIVLILISLCMVNLIRYTTVSSLASAFSRAAMIKLLPYWNWELLFNEQCLVSNPSYSLEFLTEDDCMSCESIGSVDFVENISYETLVNDYLRRDAPVIITDGTDDWPVMTSEMFSVNNITQLYLYNEKLYNTIPCQISTNIRYRSSDMAALLRMLEKNNIDKYFIHWRNCDIDAVKAMRKFYHRPYFISNSVSPSHFNWVLISSDYTSNKFKKVDVSSGLIMIVQLKGKTSFKLAPLFPCDESCLQLNGDLHQGEILIFTSFLWSLEYQPKPEMENIAIVTETIWENRSL